MEIHDKGPLQAYVLRRGDFFFMIFGKFVTWLSLDVPSAQIFIDAMKIYIKDVPAYAGEVKGFSFENRDGKLRISLAHPAEAVQFDLPELTKYVGRVKHYIETHLN